jgi:hypothetical protein
VVKNAISINNAVDKSTISHWVSQISHEKDEVSLVMHTALAGQQQQSLGYHSNGLITSFEMTDNQEA